MLMIITTVITTFADIALTFQEIESQAASVQQSSNRGLTESLSRCTMFVMIKHDDNDGNDDNDDCVRNIPLLRFHQLRKQSDLVLIRSVQVLIVILMKVILRGRYKMPLYQFRPNRGEMYHKISTSASVVKNTTSVIFSF